MKDMPPEFLSGVRASPMWPVMAAQVGSHRPDGESLAWAESAPLPELFASVRIPVEVLLGEETFPVMITAADAIVAAIPGATHKRMPGANHFWEPAPMAVELAAFVIASK
jgi:pimeloyl-ACP methyl ester carboxylesterase